jgi:plasmid stabilization system protein ParE
MNPRIHPKARLDQRRQFEYLREAHAGPATLQKFIDAIREAKRKIGDHPTTWSFVPGSKRVRRVQIRAFRMQIVYVVMPNGTPFILEIAGPGVQPRWLERF